MIRSDAAHAFDAEEISVKIRSNSHCRDSAKRSRNAQSFVRETVPGQKGNTTHIKKTRIYAGVSFLLVVLYFAEYDFFISGGKT